MPSSSAFSPISRSRAVSPAWTTTPTAAAKKENPRRPTAKDRKGNVRESHGYRSLEIIRQKPGITYEAFIAAGGRARDLRWDVKFGRVAVT
jgi:hypothetical protein